MEKGPNFSEKSEKTADKKDGKSKYVPKKIGSAIPLAAEKASVTKESDTEERRILAESVLGKLTGESEESTKKTEQAEKQKEVDPEREAEISEVAIETSDAEHEEAVKSSVELAETLEDQSAHRMAEDLAEGQEISLHDAVRVPIERDPNIISEALDIAEQADTTSNQGALDSPTIRETAEEPMTEIEPQDEATEDEVPPATPRPVFEMSAEQQQGASQQEESTRPNGVVPPTPPMPPVPMASFGAEHPMPEYMAPRSVSVQEQSSNEIRQIAEAAAWGERQKGRREGVFAGMLLGGGIEHFRHKRREKKAEKQRKQAERAQEKRIEKLESDYVQAREAQVAERVTRAREVAEQKQAQQATMQEQLNKTREVARTQEQQAEQAEQLAVPEGHHIEQSAWHTIEVDEQGRAVENGAIAYGHEYYEERRHESAPKDVVHEAAGEVALVAAALHDDPHDVLPDPRTTYSTQAVSEQAPVSESRQKKTTLQAITTPPSTPAGTLGWLLVLALLVVILILVAR